MRYNERFNGTLRREFLEFRHLKYRHRTLQPRAHRAGSLNTPTCVPTNHLDTTLRGSIISMPPNCHRCGRLGQPQSGKMPLHVNFKATGLSSGSKYSVNFGDGSPIVALNTGCNVNTTCDSTTGVAGYDYTTAGTYTATLIQASKTIRAATIHVSSSATPLITALSPQQGDQWIVGQTYHITWLPFSASADTSVYLSGGGNAEGYSKFIGSPSVGTNYYIDYAVTSADLPIRSGNSWKVAVCDGKMQPGGTNCGWSGEIFIVPSASAPAISAFIAGQTERYVQVNGGVQNATGPFSFNWGDGTKETGYFPLSHTYAQDRQYVVFVCASNTSGQTCAPQMVVDAYQSLKGSLTEPTKNGMTVSVNGAFTYSSGSISNILSKTTTSVTVWRHADNTPTECHTQAIGGDARRCIR